VIGDLFVIKTTQAPASTATRLTIRVIGHQWWWEVRYPGTNAVTANELHIPARTPVRVVVSTADVIHSFWVPQLNRKIDMVPGMHNRVLLYSNRTGVFRGQCSQFCGFQHAHMSMYVFVQPRAAFNSWLTNMSAPAARPSGAQARTGEKVFMNAQCASCHQIRGTPAQATVGPDLTHLATRSSLASVTIRNDRAELAAWLRDPQTIKPRARMPDLGLSRSKVDSLVDYLGGLH
jgi:cytochrome c oxidase subunit 2